MNLWRKTDKASKDVVLSAELCKKGDLLEATWPQVKEAWEAVDREQVLPAAGAVATAAHTQSHDRLVESRETLKRAIWERDDHKAAYQRKLAELHGEIEILSGPVIVEKVTEWQASLSELREKRVVKVDEKFTNFAAEQMPHLVKYSSNFAALAEAKSGLLTAIKTLREMRHRPLSEIHAFVENIESKMKKLDFSALVEASEPVTEQRYHEIISGPDVKVYDTSMMSRYYWRGM